jgi:hypothetical protein
LLFVFNWFLGTTGEPITRGSASLAEEKKEREKQENRKTEK